MQTRSNGVGSSSTRRQFLMWCGAAGAAAALAGCCHGTKATPATQVAALAGLKMAQRKGTALGSDISMIALHEDPAAAERGLDAAFAAMRRVERVMSIYLADSQLSKLNAGGSVANPDEYFVRVLRESAEYARLSDGAFDITVQPLWTLYFTSQKNGGKLPADEQIDRARKAVDWQGVAISEREIRLKDKSMAITLNGIAQGFAADRAMEAIKAAGIKHALVNTGEIASLGRKADGGAWTVGIQHPRQADAFVALAKLEGRCMSTSGDYATAFTNDRKYNHIFDPATGRSPEAFSSVTVVAPTATAADALSTAIFVLGPEKGMELVKSQKDTDVLLIMKDGRTLASENFPVV